MAIDIKAQSKRVFDEVWNSGRLNQIDELFDASYQGSDPLLGTLDRDALKQSVKSYRDAFPDLKFEVVEVLCEGETAVVRWTATGTQRGELLGNPATGRYATTGGISIIAFRKGRVVNDYTQWDAMGLMRQLGVEASAPLSAPSAGEEVWPDPDRG